MSFYEELSNYYHIIFPPQQGQVDFLQEAFQKTGGNKILDVACANGGYTIELAKRDFQVVGFDLEEKMITLAQEQLAVAQKENTFLSNVKFYIGDMRHSSNFGTDFNGVFCIGNSLVHLTETPDLLQGVNEFYNALLEGGVVVIQLVNYDKIVKYKSDALPTIHRETASLDRNYVHLSNGLIDFQTVLTVKGIGGEEQRFNNSVLLKPLLKEQLKEIFAGVGFKNINFFGGFDGSTHTETSPATVMVASK